MKDLFDLTDRSVVVTGGGGGIGNAICATLGARGAHILFTDIDQRVIDKTVKKFRDEGLKVDGYLCRSSDEGEVVSFFEKVSKDFGAPDILVNNAAAAIHIPPQDTSLQEWDRVIGASLTGYFLNAREFYRRSHAAGKPGVIVNIASIAGSSAIGRGNFAYSVAKGGVIQMTRGHKRVSISNYQRSCKTPEP